MCLSQEHNPFYPAESLSISPLCFLHICYDRSAYHFNSVKSFKTTFFSGSFLELISCRSKMYGMLLESIQHYLIEKYGEEKWDEIRERAGISDHIFITHQRYSESFLKKLAEAAEEILGEETSMISDDFMNYFGSCFVKFFSHYGYDRIIRVSGRHLRDFLIGIDNLHEHMRFGYPKMQSPSFFCEEETSAGLTLHYISKRKGFMHYVIGQVQEIATSFYNLAEIDIKILSNEIKNNTTHVVYRLGFDNSGYRPPCPDSLTIHDKRSVSIDIFFNIFPFSFALSCDMTVNMAGHGIISTVGNRLVGNDVRELFTMRRPKAEFTWETVRNIFLLEITSLYIYISLCLVVKVLLENQFIFMDSSVKRNGLVIHFA